MNELERIIRKILGFELYPRWAYISECKECGMTFQPPIARNHYKHVVGNHGNQTG